MNTTDTTKLSLLFFVCDSDTGENCAYMHIVRVRVWVCFVSMEKSRKQTNKWWIFFGCSSILRINPNGNETWCKCALYKCFGNFKTEKEEAAKWNDRERKTVEMNRISNFVNKNDLYLNCISLLLFGLVRCVLFCFVRWRSCRQQMNDGNI